MELIKAINERKSIRGFKPDPVSKDTLKEILQISSRAISSVNSQPWEMAVITGEALRKLGEDNVTCLREGVDEDFPDVPIEGVYRERRVELAKQLFKVMDIAREDREKRDWWMERGYRFFDAPVAIILYMDGSIDESRFRFDIGCLTQNICLVAQEYGLATCVEDQAIIYQRGLHQLGIPKDKQMVTGIAIGYPDWDFPANNVTSNRADIDQMTTWYGFE